MPEINTKDIVETLDGIIKEKIIWVDYFQNAERLSQDEINSMENHKKHIENLRQAIKIIKYWETHHCL